MLLAGCGGGGVDGSTPDGTTPASTLSLTLTPTTLALVEGAGAQDVSVTLVGDAAESRTVNLAFDPAIVSVSPTQLVLSGGTPQTLSIAPVDDVDSNDQMATVTLSGPAVTTAVVTTTVEDDDLQSIVATPAQIDLNEGRGATVNVRLAQRPASAVTVTVASSDGAKAAVNPAFVVFDPTDWDQDKPISVTASDDPDASDESVRIDLAAAGALPASVTVNIVDDDELSLLFDPATLTLVEGGPLGTFTLQLSGAPSTPIVIEAVNTNLRALRLFPPTVRFNATNWNIPETISVTPSDDDDTDDVTVPLRLRSAFFPEVTVTVTIRDDDDQRILIEPASQSVAEGSQGSFTVRLSHKPSNPVTVTLSASDSAVLGLSQSALTFTASDFGTARAVVVTGRPDADVTDDPVVVTARLAGVPDATTSVLVTDVDTQSILVSPSALSVPEGMTGTVSVALSHQPSSAVTVNLSVGTSTVVQVSPTSLTFDTSRYGIPQQVFVTAASDTDTADAAASLQATAAGIGGASVPITIIDRD